MEHTGFHDKEHYSPDCYECNHDKRPELCPICGAHLGNWQEVFANDVDRGNHICGEAK